MLKINFNEFWDMADKDVQCSEDDKGFLFVYDYYSTFVSINNIKQFAKDMEISYEEAYNDFKTYYCDDLKKESDIVDPGEDVIDESEDYEAYMIRILTEMERKIVASISKIPLEKSINKTFGEFLSDLMNSVNLLPFVKRIKSFVKSGLIKGMESAEEEVGVQIGFTERFNEKLTILADQQLTGYTMPDGKAWHGIQGATKDLQLKILKTVQEDVVNKVPKKEMIKNVQEVFEGSGFNQAARIARTESNRFINEGKLTGYIESGIPGKKVYDAVGDNKTSPICRRLSAKYDKGIAFEDEFVDDETGWRSLNPPAHVNCRCVIAYRKA